MIINTKENDKFMNIGSVPFFDDQNGKYVIVAGILFVQSMIDNIKIDGKILSNVNGDDDNINDIMDIDILFFDNDNTLLKTISGKLNEKINFDRIKNAKYIKVCYEISDEDCNKTFNCNFIIDKISYEI